MGENKKIHIESRIVKNGRVLSNVQKDMDF